MSVWADIHRRSNGKQIRKEDFFNYTKASPSVADLDPDTNGLLREVDEFTGYPPFIPGCIHDEVDVVLKDSETRGITKTVDEMKEELHRLEEELDRLEKAGAQEEQGGIRKKIKRLEDIIDSCIKAGKGTYTFEVELLGKYVRVAGKPTIYLMWGTLRRLYPKAPRPSSSTTLAVCPAAKDYTILTAIVYVHELMHAYFDRHHDEKGHHISHQYCPEIEEPLAEFGMLSFMEMFDRAHPNYKLLEHAIEHVKEKKDSLGTCHYGYGYFLFEDRKNFCVDWVELFYMSCLSIDESGIDMKSYKSMISPIRYPCHEYLCETTLYKIVRPRRFFFSSKVGIYPVGAKHIERIEIPISKAVCKNRVFRADYLYMAPLEVYITFVESSGVKIRGKSMIYKKTSKKAPTRYRFYIKSDKELLVKYASALKTGGNFLFYEDIPADGYNLAEWIAKRMV